MTKITANGNQVEVNPSCRLSEWLTQIGWKPTQVVIELNGEVVPRSQVKDVILNDGDTLEVVFPVAGG